MGLRWFELLQNEEEASDALSSELYLLASSIKHVRGEVISSLSLSLSLRTGQISFPQLFLGCSVPINSELGSEK